MDCGETDPRVLDFDHVREIKRAGVFDLMDGYVSDKVLLNEIRKCDVRCSNCHRRKTVMGQNTWRARFWQKLGCPRRNGEKAE